MQKTLLFLLFYLAAATASAQVVLVVGDSLSAAYNIPIEQGWVQLLQKQLELEAPGEHRVINASITGDTTASGLARLPRLLDEYQPDLVLLELGGNDGLRGLPLSAMQQNLGRMVTLSREAGAQVVMVGVNLPVSYGWAFNRRFRAVFQQVHEELEVPLVEWFFNNLGDRNLLQEDGVHPTAAAQPKLLATVWPVLSTMVE